MPIPTQWNNIMPNFSGSAQSMNTATENFNQVGNVANQYMQGLKQEQERKDKLAREAKQDAQWDKQFSLQEMANTRAGLQADREAQKYVQELATDEAQAKASEYLNAARSNVVTPQQADQILAAYNKNPKADVLGLQAKAVKQYEASPTMQKNFIGNVSIDQGPMEKTIQTIDPTTGEVVDKILQAAPDMKEAQARKDMILSDLDKKIQQDSLMAWDKEKFGTEVGFKKQELGLRRKALEVDKAPKFQPYTVTVGYDSKGQYTNDPSKIAYKSQVNINSPRMEAAVSGKYGTDALQLGTLSDFIPNRDRTSKTQKSVYSGGMLKTMQDRWGGYDASKILSMAEVVLKANPNISPDAAIGVVEDVASKGVTDAVYVKDVNDRLLDLGYTGTILKK
jgi:hypothetical protein